MAGAGKKDPVLVSERVARVLDKLSKAALIDLCADMVRRAEGADIGDWELVCKLADEYLPPVLRERGDRPPNWDIYWGGITIVKGIAEHGYANPAAAFQVASLIHEGIVAPGGTSLTEYGHALLAEYAELLRVEKSVV